MRIYRGGAIPSPAVIYCHAGAFMLGNLDTDHRQCVELARRGRLAPWCPSTTGWPPSTPSPPRLDDAMTVLQWTWTTGPDLGLDRDAWVARGETARARRWPPVWRSGPPPARTPPIAGVTATPAGARRSPHGIEGGVRFHPRFRRCRGPGRCGGITSANRTERRRVPARSHQMIGAASTFITCSELDPLRELGAGHAAC